MNKKIPITVAVIAVIALVATIVIFLMPPHITIAYSEMHGKQYIGPDNQYISDPTYSTGTVTWVQFYLNVTTTKSTQFSLNDFTVTYNDQPVTILKENTGGIVNLSQDRINDCVVGYILEGELSGIFKLTYNGMADVELKQ